MSISIIIPTYNAGEFLSATIQGVLSQTIGDWELIIVDDGSTDSTESLASHYALGDKRIRLVRQGNAGVGAARNRGYRESSPSHEYVIFLDQDDVWEADALEVLSSALDSNPQCAAAHGLCCGIDAAGARLPGFVPPTRSCFTLSGFRVCLADEWTTFGVFLNGNFIYTPGQALMRRRALFNGDPFDVAMVPSDDWDLWLRLTRRGPLVFVNRTVLGWRQHEGNQSRKKLRMARARRRLYEKLSASDLTNGQRELLTWYFQATAMHRAYRRDLRRASLHASTWQGRWAALYFWRAVLGIVKLRREQRKVSMCQAASVCRNEG